MARFSYPTERELRQAVLARVAEFCELTGMSRTEIGVRALNDSRFVHEVAERNFTVGLYGRLMDWLDANWPESRRRTRAKGGNA